MSEKTQVDTAGPQPTKALQDVCITLGAAGEAVEWHACLLKLGDVIPVQTDDGVIEHNIDWLLAQCDEANKAVLVLHDDRGAAVPLFVHDGQVDLFFSEVSLGRVKVRRHVLVGNFPDQPAIDWASAVDALANAVPGNGAVFLLGLVGDEGLGIALAKGELKRRFFVSEQGAEYARRLCVLGDSLEAYLASLPAKSRQDLRRSLRRFESNFAGRFAFSTHCSVAEVSDFLSRVEAVSKRTYQARQLGLGIVADSYIGNKVLEGASRGYARCYMMTLDDQPIAWRIGFLYNKIYCSHHVGYDPQFDKWHPGVVMHLHSVRDLSENCDGVHTLDMLYGDNDFKRKASNLSRMERNYYLFPRTLRGASTYLALRSCNGFSEWIGRMLERYGLKVRLKGWLRRG